MGVIALILAVIAFSLLWYTENDLLKWTVLLGGIVAAYFRAVVSSIQKRGSLISSNVSNFWNHAAVIAFWLSIIISIIGFVKVF